MVRPNDTRMLGKKFGSDAGGGEVKPWHRGERVAGRAESSQRPQRNLELGSRVWRRRNDPWAGRLSGGSEKIPSIGLVV